MDKRIAVSVTSAVLLAVVSCGTGRPTETNLKVAILERPEPEIGAGSHLPPGTRILVRTDALVSSRSVAAGDRVSARISETIQRSGFVLASAGTEAVVRVVDSRKAGLTLRLSQIRLSASRYVDVLSEALTVGQSEIPPGSVLAFQLQNAAEIPR